jgi:methionyl-tRNA formyltransferase
MLQFEAVEPELRVVFMGTPEFAVPALKALVLNQYEVVAVYTQPERPAGRGRAPGLPPVKNAALEAGLEIVQPRSLKDAEEVAKLAAYRPDVIVVAAYGKLLPPPVLDTPQHGCLNIHPSLLPKYRGASPVAAAILAGDAHTGVSIMLLDHGLDTGPVLSREKVEILPGDTTGTLTGRLAEVAARMLPGVLEGWVRGEITPGPQDKAQASYTRPLTKEDGEIDWRQPAVEIWRRVRAFQPWPGAFTRWRGKRLEITAAAPLPGNGNLSPGTVVAVDREGASLGVVTGDGVLGLVMVQQEGKKALSSSEFLRGQRQFVGAVLPSGRAFNKENEQ